ncbi:transcriptional regulator [Dellaglioa algida]|nr:transcriptional regulator [Dellaglioa algida]
MVAAMSLLSRTKEISKKKGISIEKLADTIGVSKSGIYQWDKHEPKPSTVEKVANVLNVSTDYLLGRTDTMSTQNQIEEVDLREAKHEILSYGGKPISDEDWAIIKRILESGISE